MIAHQEKITESLILNPLWGMTLQPHPSNRII